MEKYLVLIFLLVSCGQHSAESYGYKNAGETTTIIQDQSEMAIFAQAIQANEMDTLKSMIEKGFNLDIPLKNGNPPLIEAILWERIDVVILFLEKGANPEVLDGEGVSAKEYAKDASEEIYEIFYPKSEDQRESVYLIIDEENTQGLKDLIERGVDLNIFNEDGETPLTYAILAQKELIVHILLWGENGINVNLANKSGERPLTLAIRLNLKRAEQLLREKNAIE